MADFSLVAVSPAEAEKAKALHGKKTGAPRARVVDVRPSGDLRKVWGLINRQEPPSLDPTSRLPPCGYFWGDGW